MPPTLLLIPPDFQTLSQVFKREKILNSFIRMQIFPYGQKIRVKVVCVVAKIRRAAAASTVFYFAKSRQDLGLGGLASRGGPEGRHKWLPIFWKMS